MILIDTQIYLKDKIFMYYIANCKTIHHKNMHLICQLDNKTHNP